MMHVSYMNEKNGENWSRNIKDIILYLSIHLSFSPLPYPQKKKKTREKSASSSSLENLKVTSQWYIFFVYYEN